MTIGTIQVSWLDSLHDLPRSEWDRLASDGGFYLSHAWLSLQETDPGSRRRYAIAMAGDQLLGGISVDYVEDESNDNYRFAAVLPEGHDTPALPLMLLGGHGGYASGIALEPSLDHDDRQQTVQLLLDHIIAAAKDHGRTAAFFYLQDQYRDLVTRATSGQEPLLARYEAAIELPGQRWDDYLASLPGPRRVKVRREERVFRKAGYDIGVGELTPWLQEAGTLLASLQQKYGHQADPAAMSDLLRAQVDNLGEHVAFHCHDETGVVGFMLAFPLGGTLHMRAGGFDYERLRRCAEYFNLCYYLPIQWAYEHAMTRLHLGTGSLEAKVLRGAKLSPLWVTPVGWSWSDSDLIRMANNQRAS